MEKLKVSFIGTGNVAWHLAPALDNAGYIVKEVFGRSSRNALSLIDRLYQAEIAADLDFSKSESTLFVIAVSDEAIEHVAREIVLPDNAILVHTSGSQSMDVLEYANALATGVFYPLQTFTVGRHLDLNDVPFFIESSSPYAQQLLIDLAKELSETVLVNTATDRQAIHIAAVFACNFTNHMFNLANDLMASGNFDFDLLKPLIVETINKMMEVGPQLAQTGPARRMDSKVLAGHVEALENSPVHQKVYQLISQQIMDRYDDPED